MKREEFWLGVCVYLLIVLAGHLGPDFSKIGFLNERIGELFRHPVQGTKEKLIAPMALQQKTGNSFASERLIGSKHSSGYLRAQAPKHSSDLKAKVKRAPYESTLPSHGPLAPISFSL